MIKEPRRHSEKHLAFIRRLPSLIKPDQGGPVEAAHIRYAHLPYGKRYVGMAEKPDDMWVVPLSPEAHRAQHAMSERMFWAEYGIDPLLVAALLWLHSGNEQAATQVIMNARSIGQ